MEPQIRYTTTADGVSIAYCEAGEGTPFVETQPAPWNNIEAEFREWEWHRIMASRRRLIRFDNRGSGSSQRNVDDYSVEAMALDIAAVADALSLDTFALSAEQHAAPAVIAYAARHPERVSHLILHDGFARVQDVFDLPRMKSLLSLLEQGDWELFTDSFSLVALGWDLADVARELGAFARSSTTLDEARRFFAAARSQDVTPLLAELQVRTMVMQTRGAQLPTLDMARRLAAAIPGAQLRILESETHWSNEIEPQILAALDEFIGDGGQARAEKVAPHIERIVSGTAIIMFTDIVDSTALTERLGDAAFRERARSLGERLLAIIQKHAGTAIDGKLLGDGVLAMFSAASGAIDAGLQCAAAGEEFGLQLHLGLHAGDVIREEGNVFGGAVNIASRIAALSGPDELLVSDTVRSLARTSAGVRFEDRGEQMLKGVGDAQRVFAVTRA